MNFKSPKHLPSSCTQKKANTTTREWEKVGRNEQNEKNMQTKRKIFLKNSIQMTERVSNPLIWSLFCLYPQTSCCSWSLTSEIIIYDPKQLSGLGLSWAQEFQKPLGGWRNLCLRSFTVLRSSTALYLDRAGAGIANRSLSILRRWGWDSH